MKIYTRTGDQGETGLLGAARVSKADQRIDCLGTIDELNASLGCLRAAWPTDGGQRTAGGETLENSGLGLDWAPERERLLAIQKRLFEIGAAIADVRDRPASLDLESAIGELELAMDRMSDALPPLTSFILPAGTTQAAAAHLARAICRRAERVLVAFHSQGALAGEAGSAATHPSVLIFLNRLSDWLFLLARGLNHIQGVSDDPWPG